MTAALPVVSGEWFSREHAEDGVTRLFEPHVAPLLRPRAICSSLGLWDARNGTLFSGDAIYDGPLLDDIPGANRADYARTLERLLALPARVVTAGHDPSFGRARLQQIARGWLARRASA